MAIKPTAKARNKLRPFSKNGLLTDKSINMLLHWLQNPNSRTVTNTYIFRTLKISRRTFYTKLLKCNSLDKIKFSTVNNLIKIYNDDLLVDKTQVNKKISRKGLHPFAKNGILSTRQKELLNYWMNNQEARIISDKDLMKRLNYKPSQFYKKIRKECFMDDLNFGLVNRILSEYNKDVTKSLPKKISNVELNNAEKEKLRKILEEMTK